MFTRGCDKINYYQMKIGVLGGSFNPPHLGHLIVSQQLIDFGFVDQVWLMPCYAHVWHKKLAPVKNRLTMCRFLANKKIKVSTLEIDQKKPMSTITTLKLLEKKYPKQQFFWLIGQKSLKELPQWNHYQELIKNYKFLILPQNSKKLKIENCLPSRQAGKLKIISHPLWATSNLSSSVVRKRIKKGLSLKGFVPEKVAAYIKKHRLYQS